MIRAIARQAEVERTRRAKMIHATGEIKLYHYFPGTHGAD